MARLTDPAWQRVKRDSLACALLFLALVAVVLVCNGVRV